MRADDYSILVAFGPGVKNRRGERLTADDSLAISNTLAGAKWNRGYLRGPNGELITGDGTAVPNKWRRGDLIDANGALVVTTQVAGSVVRQGYLRNASTGAMVVTQTTGGGAGPAPTLTQLQPDNSGQWNQEVRLIGTNFTSQSVILVNGVVRDTTYVSATELRTIVQGGGAAGNYQVKVRNADGQETAALTYTKF